MNSVRLAGKVSRVSPLKYTPAGMAIVELTLAVPQKYLEQDSIGYFDTVLLGEVAEKALDRKLKIGDQVEVQGSIWTRSFKNRQGGKVTETKIFAETIEERS